ncbi:MAG: lytic transglycosylase domain-containing protein, partial [Brevundimonas sp.]|nr:lytic transglycosylase domain-containing protein [Brevundimonas sp.]
ANLTSKAGQGMPALPSSPVIDALSPKDRMIADQMDRMRQDQGLLALLLGQEGEEGNAGFLRAFVGTTDA